MSKSLTGLAARVEFPIPTVGGAAVPPTSRFASPTLCFATPTFGRFGGFRAIKRRFLTLAMQNYYICRQFPIQFLVYIGALAYQNIQSTGHFAPPTFPEKLHPWLAEGFEDRSGPIRSNQGPAGRIRAPRDRAYSRDRSELPGT